MKQKLPLLALIAALSLGTICLIQSRKIAEHKAQIASLDQSIQQKNEQVEQLQASQERMQQQNTLRPMEVPSLPAVSQPANPPRATESVSAAHRPGEPEESSSGAALGGFLSKMLADPDTKKLIQEQQRMMMDQLYGPLLKQLGLTQGESDKFKDLLASTVANSTERASALLSAGAGTNRAGILKSMAADSKVQEDQMKELLGEGRYGQYKEYQLTAGDRMQLNLFKQQFGGGDSALTEPQTEQLLGFMKEEKQLMAVAGQPIAGVSQDQGNMGAMLSEEHADSLLQTQEDVNERVFERARAVLSPEQLNSFGKFQTNQVQMMRMGMGMARKMFAPVTP